MFARYLWIWICCFIMGPTLSVNAQNKIEKEYRIKPSQVPKEALDFIKKCPFKKKIKWYIEDGHEPSPTEAKERLYYLQEHGETPYAFSFKSKFTPEDATNYQKL